MLFALIILEIWSHFLPRLPILGFPPLAEMIGIYHCIQLLVEMRSHKVFALKD
jgi:hypothetical protein